jgi:hypothetical protein
LCFQCPCGMLNTLERAKFTELNFNTPSADIIEGAMKRICKIDAMPPFPSTDANLVEFDPATGIVNFVDYASGSVLGSFKVTPIGAGHRRKLFSAIDKNVIGVAYQNDATVLHGTIDVLHKSASFSKTDFGDVQQITGVAIDSDGTVYVGWVPGADPNNVVLVQIKNGIRTNLTSLAILNFNRTSFQLSTLIPGSVSADGSTLYLDVGLSRFIAISTASGKLTRPISYDPRASYLEQASYFQDQVMFLSSETVYSYDMREEAVVWNAQMSVINANSLLKCFGAAGSSSQVYTCIDSSIGSGNVYTIGQAGVVMNLPASDVFYGDRVFSFVPIKDVH